MVSIALVTGGAGFIGRELCHQLYLQGHHIVVVDKLTYAARPDLLEPYRDRLKLVEADVYDLEHLHGADVVFHLAAESHVDNSITDAGKFIQSNIGGTYRLLELVAGQRPHDRPTLIHVSTDEVYGDVPKDWASWENDALRPSSPYSASKAAADMLVLAWQRTHGLKARIVRPSNCYGPFQYPEKLIPKVIRSWRLGRPMTIHGDGEQTRSWLSVEDCARALTQVWAFGEDGGIYNVPGNCEMSVRMVVEWLQGLCGERSPHWWGGTTPHENTWGCERPGGDLAYRVDGELLTRLGWVAKGHFLADLAEIVRQELEQELRI